MPKSLWVSVDCLPTMSLQPPRDRTALPGASPHPPWITWIHAPPPTVPFCCSSFHFSFPSCLCQLLTFAAPLAKILLWRTAPHPSVPSWTELILREVFLWQLLCNALGISRAFTPPTILSGQVVLPPFLRWGNWGSEMLNDLHKDQEQLTLEPRALRL